MMMMVSMMTNNNASAKFHVENLFEAAAAANHHHHHYYQRRRKKNNQVDVTSSRRLLSLFQSKVRFGSCSSRNNNGLLLLSRKGQGGGGLVVKAEVRREKDVGIIINGSYLGESRSSSQLLSSHHHHDCGLLGRFVEGKFVYRQTFVIRSYEIGADKTATMETLMNLLQETALNHVTSSGLAGNGFGATREMSLRKLIWVVTRIHVQVDKYSSWGDVVEIETWVDAAGKNAMRRDWIIRNSTTQRIITRATSTWVIMNRETRRLSKIPDEVKEEVKPFYLKRNAIPSQHLDVVKIEKLVDRTPHDILRSSLAPRWSDMDANQHVNNVKYIGWILESVPTQVLEEYNLRSMTLEYRRECRQSNVLESLTSTRLIRDKCGGEEADLESTHLLRMQADQAEIVRARSLWHSKQ